MHRHLVRKDIEEGVNQLLFSGTVAQSLQLA